MKVNFKMEILKNQKILYNDGDKIYEGEIHNGLYEGEGIEYCPILKDRINYRGKFKNNLYELPDLDLVENKDKTIINSSRIVLYPWKNMCYCSFIRS